MIEIIVFLNSPMFTNSHEHKMLSRANSERMDASIINFTSTQSGIDTAPLKGVEISETATV